MGSPRPGRRAETAAAGGARCVAVRDPGDRQGPGQQRRAPSSIAAKCGLRRLIAVQQAAAQVPPYRLESRHAGSRCTAPPGRPRRVAGRRSRLGTGSVRWCSAQGRGRFRRKREIHLQADGVVRACAGGARRAGRACRWRGRQCPRRSDRVVGLDDPGVRRLASDRRTVWPVRIVHRRLRPGAAAPRPARGGTGRRRGTAASASTTRSRVDQADAVDRGGAQGRRIDTERLSTLDRVDAEEIAADLVGGAGGCVRAAPDGAPARARRIAAAAPAGPPPMISGSRRTGGTGGTR